MTDQLDWYVRNLGTGSITTYLVRFDATMIQVFEAPGVPQQTNGWREGIYDVGVVNGDLQVFAPPIPAPVVPWPVQAEASIDQGGQLEYLGFRFPVPTTHTLDWYLANLGSGPVDVYRVHFTDGVIDIFDGDPHPSQANGWMLDDYWIGVVDGQLQVYPPVPPIPPLVLPFPWRVIITIDGGQLNYYGLRPFIPTVPPLPPFSGNGGGEWPVGTFDLMDGREDETWLADELCASDLWLEARRGLERGKRPFKQRKHIRGS